MADEKQPTIEIPDEAGRRGTILATKDKLEGAVYTLPPASPRQPAATEKYQVLIERELQRIDSRKVDWRQIADVSFMVILFGLGILLVSLSEDGFVKSIGNVLYGGGFIPGLIAAWALVTGAPSYRKYNTIKVIAGIILTIIGVIILIAGGEDALNTIGSSMCEVSTLFVISRLFFLAEDNEREIEKLQKQLKEARQATGAGLALSYYYNFLLRMINDLSDLNNKNDNNNEESNYGKKIIKLTINKSDKENGIKEYLLEEPIMTIFMPRTLNKINMNDVLKTLGYEGCFKYYSGYRAMSVNFLKHWISTNNNQKCVSGMCCMPTVVSSIYRRWEEVEERIKNATSREEREAILPIDIEQEMLDFQNCLIGLINSNEKAKKHLKIISIPPLPDSAKLDEDKLWHAIKAVESGKMKELDLNLS